ncbi:hypothetical protein ceV_234 [Chrysochromulina ericina virus CeV-01B]|uniref:Uncharacterized protein n=1 Tax=Chrysochromulina ericina virus CeV-01B TaxID=3070830 RepID=A0A0N9QQN3_9VIRU|nr:hypothetical protein ceV_234 [Chrysochromulina ericina virus]ALH23140.1 hypothetical protein ceV_234 [Chrysochromulina ericina virus CeV-01B]
MKKLFTFIILSQLCFTSLSYVQDILDDLEFITVNPSPSPSLSPSPSPSPSPLLNLIPYIYNFVNNNNLF